MSCFSSGFSGIEKAFPVGERHKAFMATSEQDLSALITGLGNCRDFCTKIEVVPFLDRVDPTAYLTKIVDRLANEIDRPGESVARFWNEESPFEANGLASIEAKVQSDQQLAFQAIKDVTSNQPVFFETFTRWPNLNQSSGYQSLFSEDSDLEALSQAISLLEENPGLHLSVNLPRQRFVEPFLAQAEALLADKSVDARQRLIIEIVEAWSVADYFPIRDQIPRLKKLDCQIAFDDVGAGILPLYDLLELQPQYLKLDRIFVQNSISSLGSISLLKGFSSWAEELGAKLVAEGVESEDQSNQLVELGIHLQQGFFVAKEQSKPTLQA